MPDEIEAITDERGERYGTPLDHFACTGRMADEWFRRYMRHNRPQAKVPPTSEHALMHGVHMICDKLVRAASDPTHKDNWDDIEGYVRCIKTFLFAKEATRD